jgi:hypothetical protein
MTPRLFDGTPKLPVKRRPRPAKKTAQLVITRPTSEHTSFVVGTDGTPALVGRMGITSCVAHLSQNPLPACCLPAYHFVNMDNGEGRQFIK